MEDDSLGLASEILYKSLMACLAFIPFERGMFKQI
jgi:hypothetical protein